MNFEERADRAIENGECGAQLAIYDDELRRALKESIVRELRACYETGLFAAGVKS